MSIVTETFVICDKAGCDESFGVDDRHRSPSAQRRKAKENNWTSYRGFDLCPKHSAIMLSSKKGSKPFMEDKKLK